MPRPCDHVIFTDLDGAEGVLVDLNTKQYFRLNETASLIWRGLSDGTPADAIATNLTERYEVTLEHAQASVQAAVASFNTHHLLEPAIR